MTGDRTIDERVKVMAAVIAHARVDSLKVTLALGFPLDSESSCWLTFQVAVLATPCLGSFSRPWLSAWSEGEPKTGKTIGIPPRTALDPSRALVRV